MKKSLGFLPKILSGEKTIESRWYVTRRAPWGIVAKGDTVYFKNTGEPASLKATVDDILFLSDLAPQTVKSLLSKYGTLIGIAKKQTPFFFKQYKHKKYCMLLFLKHPQKVKPFHIRKSGFGAMTAWITTHTLAAIRDSRAVK